MKRKLPFIFLFLVIGCSDNSEKSEIKKVTYHEKLERIQAISDSIYNRFSEDSTVKYETYRLDSSSVAFASYRSDTLIAIVFRTNGIDTSVAEYYPNGQIIGDVNFLESGRLDGPATYYYPDGRVKTIGQFKNGKWWGKWKNYDESGNLIEFEYYDENGQFG
ncbi:MAG: hypothetical protein AAF632_25335 [Bacteroidota bacterium]